MAIKVGDRLPAGKFGIMTKDGPGSLSTQDLFGGKKVVFFLRSGSLYPDLLEQPPAGLRQARG